MNRAVRAIPFAIAAAGLAIVIATMLAAQLSNHPDRATGLLRGGIVVYYLMPHLGLIGLGLGWSVGYHYAARSRTTPWTDAPRGLLFGHYPVAWAGAVLSGIAAIVFVIPSMTYVLALLEKFIDVLPRFGMQVVGAIFALCVIIGGWDVGRWVLRALDGEIHRQRAGNRDRALGTGLPDWGLDKGTGEGDPTVS